MSTPSKSITPKISDVEFLLTALQPTSNKPDWNAISKATGINTAGAAYMRYSRLLQRHGIVPTASDKNAAETPKKRGKPADAASANGASTEKRKRNTGPAAEEDDEDDAEAEKPKVKTEDGAVDAEPS